MVLWLHCGLAWDMSGYGEGQKKHSNQTKACWLIDCGHVSLLLYMMM